MTIQDDVKKALREEMDARGWLDPVWRAGLAAIVGGESDFIPRFETGYANTSNERIRAIFSSRVAGLSDAELNRLKNTDESWFNFIYGPDTAIGRGLGNIDPNDGYRFRGGGLNQLTGRTNYLKYGQRVGVDLLTYPGRINEPRVAAAVAVEYMKDRFRGGDFNAMKRAVGVSIGKPDAVKDDLFEQYCRSGEWESAKSQSAVVKPGSVEYDPAVDAFLVATENVQRFLKYAGLYNGAIDRDPGPATRAALRKYIEQTR